MKKIISLIIVSMLAFSFIACAPNYKGNLLHPEENLIQIQDYFEEVLGTKSDILSDEFSYSFSFKQKSRQKSLDEQIDSNYRVKGVVNYDEGFLIEELKITSNAKQKTITPSVDGKQKSTMTDSEKSVMFFNSGYLDRAYIHKKTKQKSKISSSFSEDKTTNKERSSALLVFEQYLSLKAIILKIEEFLTDYFNGSTAHHIYLNNDNMTLVESYSKVQNVIKIYSNGDEFTKIVVNCQSNEHSVFASITYTVTICNEEKIEAPKDKKDYTVEDLNQGTPL